MGRAPEFFRQLNEQLLEQLEECARQPGKQVDEVLEWLTEKGIKTSRSSVGRWLQDFRCQENAVRRLVFTNAHRNSEHDPIAIGETIAREIDGQILDKLASGEMLTTKELRDLAATRRDITADRVELIEMKKTQQNAIAAAEQQAKAGASSVDVVATIKQALGIAA